MAGAENRSEKQGVLRSRKQGEEVYKISTKHTSRLRAAAYPIEQIHFQVRKKKTCKVTKEGQVYIKLYLLMGYLTKNISNG